MLSVLETLALVEKAESSAEIHFERNGIRDKVHQRCSRIIFSDALEIKARNVTFPEDRLLMYQWRDAGVGPDKRFMMIKLVSETGGK